MIKRIKPKSGYSHAMHIGLNILLPLLVLILVRMQFAQLAVAIILLSKWRIFAVRPRYWAANIRANSVDLIIGFSVVIFMTHSTAMAMQIVWGVSYAAWLILIKPGSTVIKTATQALLAQLAGLTALYISLGGSPAFVLVIGAWAVCYLTARHFFTSFDEPYTALYSHTWGYFAAALTWILSHWLLFYGAIAQPALILSVLGYGMAALYYLDHTDRLSHSLRRQFVFIMVAVVAVVVVFSDWGDKAV
ncbi:hypothetical protein BH23PAT1_BH23PAT1_3740 [soil metagenome]